MMQNPELASLETLQALAARAGLTLTDEELTGMQPGIARNTAMGEAVRTWLSDTREPTPVSTAATPAQ